MSRPSIHDPAYEQGFLDGWRDRAEYQRSAPDYASGYRDGFRDANRRMNNAIAEATHGIPHDAAEVVRQLVKLWELW